MPPFDLDISYSQIAVFWAGLENPFNDWTNTHVEQGFAWRRQSVSFRTLDESGTAKVFVDVKEQAEVRVDTIRAIQVPFVVPASGEIEIASITNGSKVKLIHGEYLLLFETGLNEDRTMWCAFSFVREQLAAPAVLRADKELTPSHPLLMEAVSAV